MTLSISHSLFKDISLKTDFISIQKSLPGYSQDLIKSLVIDRRGLIEDSNMTAWGLHQVVGDGKVFKVVAEQGLIPQETTSSVVKVRYLDLFLRKGDKAPSHSKVVAQWDKRVSSAGDGNNILGGNGKFIVPGSKVEIPVIEATEESLSYYGATLLRSGDIVSFPESPYPIWAMSLGQHYVDHCLMKSEGFYVEYHYDQPHFHMPLSEDCSGFYLLGKRVNDFGKGFFSYHFTGFRIPFGSAVYTSGGTIHCDAALVGKKWMVGYAPAEDYSTVNVRGLTGEKVKIVPCKPGKASLMSRL